jgi:hypothetical protein
MKTRGGFVSNSSSSSFIIISNNSNLSIPNYKGDDLVVDSSFGTDQFGWEFEEYYDFGSKVIFSYLQARAINNQTWLNMLETVIKSNCNVSDITWQLDDAYIDHQSSSCEGQCVEMFDSEDQLKQFLFNNSSYIKTGNDNV